MKLQFCGATFAPLVNLSYTMPTCSGLGHTYTSHLAVSHALMLAMSSGSLEAEAGLHFQLPPTIGRRDISLLDDASDERSSVGVARSMSARGVGVLMNEVVTIRFVKVDWEGSAGHPANYLASVLAAQLELSVCPAAKVSPGGTRTALPTAPASRQR